MSKKKEYKAKLDDGTRIRFLGVTSSGHFAWEDELGLLHIPGEKGYKSKRLKEKGKKDGIE